MGQAERLEWMRKTLVAGEWLSKESLLERFEVSSATVKRDIVYLRDRMHLPVIFDRHRGRWRLDRGRNPGGEPVELDMALREDEIHALLAMQHLLAAVEPGGMLGASMAPLRRRLVGLLERGLRAPHADVARRIRVLAMGARRVLLPHYQAVAHAVLARRRLSLRYRARSSGHVRERQVSPQRLVHYRDNWYCDAWCHEADALRIFSVDAIEQVRVLDLPAQELADHELDALLTSGYGIFSGRAQHHARLRFSPERARWVAGERWHPDQRGRFDSEGHWLLDLPYSDMRELVTDILRHVPEVEVLWPQELADEVLHRLTEGVRRLGAVAG